MKVASFFSGIGGIDLGLEKAGMEIVFQCEIDPFGQQILKKHWPNCVLKGDINNVKIEDIPEADLWCGGFPCQDLSSANQGRRLGFKGDRSSLFYIFANLIYQAPKKPRWVFMENVPGLLNSRNGEDMRALLNTMDELGYCVSWRVLDAKFFGTPERRRRVYLVASYRNASSAEVLFERGSIEITDRAIHDEIHSYSPAPIGRAEDASYFAIQHACVGRKPSAGPQAKGYRNDGETYTCDSRSSSDIICKTDDPFGIRETPRISGGLDVANFDAKRWKALGNAVCVPVIEYIGKRILEVDEKNYKTKD